jgi:hypothetical protein
MFQQRTYIPTSPNPFCHLPHLTACSLGSSRVRLPTCAHPPHVPAHQISPSCQHANLQPRNRPTSAHLPPMCPLAYVSTCNLPMCSPATYPFAHLPMCPPVYVSTCNLPTCSPATYPLPTCLCVHLQPSYVHPVTCLFAHLPMYHLCVHLLLAYVLPCYLSLCPPAYVPKCLCVHLQPTYVIPCHLFPLLTCLRAHLPMCPPPTCLRAPMPPGPLPPAYVPTCLCVHL